MSEVFWGGLEVLPGTTAGFHAGFTWEMVWARRALESG